MSPVKPAACVGIDVGLRSFAVLSTGESIENPRFLLTEKQSVAKRQAKLSSEPRGTKKHEKLKRAEAKVESRVAYRRHDFVHQVSRRIVDRFGLIVVEALDVAKMIKKPTGERVQKPIRLSKGIHDASWSMFFACLAYKAEEAGRAMVAVNPAYTSQDCSGCGQRQRMPLAKRVYRCPSCGLVLDRDHNAALNILAVGLHSLGEGPRSLKRKASGAVTTTTMSLKSGE
jgi:putative transposase